MGRQSCRKRQERDNLVGVKYQFTKAIAEEYLQEWRCTPCACHICGEKQPRVAHLALRLTEDDIVRYEVAQECAIVVIAVCEACLERPDIKDQIDAVLHTALSSQTVTKFDLGRAGVPPSLRHVTKKLFGFEA